ncbi:MAG TPA: protein kinase family protein [Trebonia sp.]
MEHTATGTGWTMWKAQDETLARLVSVLTFAPGFPRIPEVVTAARAASRLTDSRLAQVFDVEDGGDQAYIVMEWVSGDSLADLLGESPLDPGRGCALIVEAARALASAHAAGQAHLLLTPQSLRWTRSSGVKITGLGIDAALAGAGLANAADPALTDTRDLAGLLYAALTGYWPCETPTTLPPAPVADGEVCTPRQVSADVPTALDAVVTRALLQRPVRQGMPILAPDALADELAKVAPPVPLPDPVPPSSTSSYNSYGDRRDGYGGGYRGQDRYGGQDGYGGYPDQRGYPQSGTFQQAGGYPQTSGFRPDPNDPSTWEARNWNPGTPSYQDRYPSRRGTGSRAMISVVVVLVLAAVAVTAWAISNNLHKSSGNNRAAGGGPSSKSSGPSPSQNATLLKPQGGESFNVLGSSPTQEDQAHANDPINDTPPAWQTQQYASPDFGKLKNGDGYLIEMGQTVKVSSVEASFAQGSAQAGICIGNSTTTSTTGTKLVGACPAGFTSIAPQQPINGDTTFTVTNGTPGQDILIWFTQLPSGSNQESISKVTVKGTTSG